MGTPNMNRRRPARPGLLPGAIDRGSSTLIAEGMGDLASGLESAADSFMGVQRHLDAFTRVEALNKMDAATAARAEARVDADPTTPDYIEKESAALAEDLASIVPEHGDPVMVEQLRGVADGIVAATRLRLAQESAVAFEKQTAENVTEMVNRLEKGVVENPSIDNLKAAYQRADFVLGLTVMPASERQARARTAKRSLLRAGVQSMILEGDFTSARVALADAQTAEVLDGEERTAMLASLHVAERNAFSQGATKLEEMNRLFVDQLERAIDADQIANESYLTSLVDSGRISRAQGDKLTIRLRDHTEVREQESLEELDFATTPEAFSDSQRSSIATRIFDRRREELLRGGAPLGDATDMALQETLAATGHPPPLIAGRIRSLVGSTDPGEIQKGVAYARQAERFSRSRRAFEEAIGPETMAIVREYEGAARRGVDPLRLTVARQKIAELTEEQKKLLMTELETNWTPDRVSKLLESNLWSGAWDVLLTGDRIPDEIPTLMRDDFAIHFRREFLATGGDADRAADRAWAYTERVWGVEGGIVGPPAYAGPAETESRWMAYPPSRYVEDATELNGGWMHRQVVDALAQAGIDAQSVGTQYKLISDHRTPDFFAADGKQIMAYFVEVNGQLVVKADGTGFVRVGFDIRDDPQYPGLVEQRKEDRAKHLKELRERQSAIIDETGQIPGFIVDLRVRTGQTIGSFRPPKSGEPFLRKDELDASSR